MPLSARRITCIIAVFLSVAMGFLFGCEDEVQGPEEVATAFLDDLRRGERASAMESIWPDTRAQIEAAHGDLESYFDGGSPVDRSQMLVVTRLESPMLIASIDARDEYHSPPEAGEEVRLDIQFRDDRSAEIPMRWGHEAGRWFVDLPIADRRALTVEQADDDEDDEANEPESAPDETMNDE